MAEKPGAKADRHHGETIVKRGGHKAHDDGHGGAWKVAFADFCLALLSLFLVLWLMAAREQEHIEQVMKAPGGNVMDEGSGILPESVGGPKGSMIAHEMPRMDTGTGPGRGDGKSDAASPTTAASGASGEPQSNERLRYDSPEDLQSLARVLARLSVEAGLANNLESVVTPYGLRVLLHDTDKQGMFERGSSVPSERFRLLLGKLGPLFSHMDNQMLVVGHTDSVQYATQGFSAFSNWSLSSNRAMTARAHLMAGGMAKDSILQVVGMADRAPLDAGNPKADINRRIELLILTTTQARTVASMFGVPGQTQLLVDGADTALPDRNALQSLRNQLAAKPGAPNAN